MKYVLGSVAIWLALNLVAFVNAWDWGRRPPRLVLQSLLKLHLFLVGIAGIVAAVAWFSGYVRP